MGGTPPRGGYPDQGCGKYSEQLSYKDWLLFNREQRTHKNILENVTLACFCMLVSGLVFPIVSIVIGGIYLLGRIIYIVGYRVSVKGRVPGAILSIFSLIALFVEAFVAVGVMIYSCPHPF